MQTDTGIIKNFPEMDEARLREEGMVRVRRPLSNKEKKRKRVRPNSLCVCGSGLRMKDCCKTNPLRNATEMARDRGEQIEQLANYIMHEVEGEPSQSEGAVECAIRLLKTFEYNWKVMEAAFEQAMTHIPENQNRVRVECMRAARESLRKEKG